MKKVKGAEIGKDFAQMTFEPTPEMFNLVKVWRVWRQKHQNFQQ